MYIIAIAWLYVAIMMAVAEPTILAGIITLLFWGVFPVSLVLYIMSSKARRRRIKQQESVQDDVHQPVRQDDAGNAKADQ